MLLLEEQCHSADDHGDRADLHERGARALHSQQEGASLLLAQGTGHPNETNGRQEEPSDDQEVERVGHAETTFWVVGARLVDELIRLATPPTDQRGP